MHGKGDVLQVDISKVERHAQVHDDILKGKGLSLNESQDLEIRPTIGSWGTGLADI